MAFRRAIPEPRYTAEDPATAAVKTWRYLRLAMVAMVIGLAVAILYEHAQTLENCWQGSISAYYYTPVQGFLVGALVTIGVCLFALKGNSDTEDALLNLAGVCAPFVALVPTPNRGSCGSVLLSGADRDLRIANNVFALLVVLGLAFAVVTGLEIANNVSGRSGAPTRVEWIAFVVSAIALIAAVLVFWTQREWFIGNVHNLAAIVMFGFIFLNVCLNARHLRSSRATSARPTRAVNRYAVIAALMLLAAVVNGLLAWAGWNYWVLSIEASLIGLFAAFWLLQTIELWNQGLRSRPRQIDPQPPNQGTLTTTGV